ncbi:probable alpha-methylacyl-coa racemase [Ramularia collo-cygni]|uniref:Probable alpha-methylacyl-coa racemase n=1 Tax=Ramularia collo-cygni TaxID=112498 RepID=A0A2D3VFB3_9PEZI|nr:probable alpha-methylacyl-coa racemase [Ramularia collo-cygni]CZT21564.1 probable alpha-methylacyl-coa racemase [Ramularia collo-cygni]
MSQSPPLTGIRVLEFAGLAPGPYAGMLCADYGAKVLRVDRAHPQAFTEKPPPPTNDGLTRHKDSITVNTKTPEGIALIKALIPRVDVVIDPFRPGVLEKMGLGPNVLQQIDRRVIVARMTGFRRDGKYKDMAGHDINYIAVSGVLSMLGRAGDKPYSPANIVGDFAGGGAVCFMGIVLALLNRHNTGLGQVVEANMVDGSAHLASMPRMLTRKPMWDSPRGTNTLDGGAPYYDTYETKDEKYMAVGALEPQFYSVLLKGLGIDPNDGQWPKNRLEKETWPQQKTAFTKLFKSKTRAEWEKIYDGTDACVTPVLTQDDLEKGGFDQRPIVTLKSSPGLAITEGVADGRDPTTGSGIGVEGNGWTSNGLRPGEGGEEVLAQWMGWARGRHYEIKEGGMALVDKSLRSKF